MQVGSSHGPCRSETGGRLICNSSTGLRQGNKHRALGEERGASDGETNYINKFSRISYSALRVIGVWAVRPTLWFFVLLINFLTLNGFSNGQSELGCRTTPPSASPHRTGTRGGLPWGSEMDRGECIQSIGIWRHSTVLRTHLSLIALYVWRFHDWCILQHCMD